MKTKLVYFIKIKTFDGIIVTQFLMLSEFHLIKTIIRDNAEVTVKEHYLPIEKFKAYFGK